MTDELVIRSAVESDVTTIENMIYQWLRWRRERADTIQRALQEEGNQVLVAELDGKVVGVLHQIFYLDFVDAGYNSHIVFLLVAEGYRGKGIGSKLLAKAIESGRERGAIEVHVDTIYDEAAEFYRRRGFKDDGVYLEFTL